MCPWLVRRYQSPLRSYLRQMTAGDLETADELAQESFIRAYQNIESFRADSQFSTWLFQIARNQFLDLKKSKGNKMNEKTRSIGEEAEGTSMIESSSNRRIMLEQGLQKLETTERELLLLNSVQEFSHQEISKIAEIPLGTVKTRLKIIKEKMRNFLEESHQ
ncbi:MAG: RNA polymerase sigma factor [Bdellovibrionales bacterium]|nr:RNA polymerase sigma factor [Bdellovibrionales bacterium]